MSLGSALLKRIFVHKTLGIPWKDIAFGRKRDPKHGKPCALLPPNSTRSYPIPAPVEFNVSHQAGLVALVGCKTDQLDAELGVDIVCVNERNDYRVIDEEGFDGWVDVYSEIFSHEESFDMKYNADAFPPHRLRAHPTPHACCNELLCQVLEPSHFEIQAAGSISPAMPHHRV